ncbi:MAG: DUF1015 domain-containing protein [Planctomycetaceae bacterium]|nr:DUF1015 domain-containing protein [Planctomycetaceae bacterium]
MEIKPFKALRYNRDVAGNPADCIAPPYDVIDADLQKRLYEKSPYNIVRADRAIRNSTDDANENVYTRARDFLEKAAADRALVEDQRPALYAYVQDFNIAGKVLQRSGIIAAGKLVEFGQGVQPHEKTLEGPKADRLNLTRATACQLGQVFMLYDDPVNIDRTLIEIAMRQEALVDAIDEEGVRHRLFSLNDPKDIDAFVRMMTDKQTIIADGHHRYETALNYWRETRNEEAGWQMMTFINMRNEGLVIQPTHRLLVNMHDFDVRALFSKLLSEFNIVRFDFDGPAKKSQARKAMFDLMKQAEKDNAFGFYAGGNAFYTIILKDRQAMVRMCPQMSPASQSLDVNVLHKLILEKHLGIGDAKLASQSNLAYIKDLGNAIDTSIAKVDAGKSQGVFFVNPTRIEQVQAVAAAGEKMPQKSTFFYPKIFSGLTIRKLNIAFIQPQYHQNLFDEESSK